ncbi:PAS domain-containing protein, partial [Marimonas arenosa]|nr:hybrid sensor histidine kinase/response regulator [Marimonas arenosa]
NNQLHEVFPSSRQGVVGMTTAEALGPETWARIAPYWQKALAGEPQVFEITHDLSGRRIRVALAPDRAGG